MNIIHLIDSGGYFGAERVLVTLATEQQAHGYNVSVISYGSLGCAEKPFEQECKKNGLNLFVWRGGSLINLYRLVGQHPQAIFHSHGYKFTILLALLRCRFWSCTFVATVHGYTSAPRFSKLYCYYQLNKLALKMLAGTVFVSRQAASDSSKKLDDKNRMIYNGIADQISERNLNDADRQFVGVDYLIAVGRLSAEKAFDDLIKSFTEVALTHCHLRLLIVGDGAELLKLKQLAASNPRIHFIGHKENPLPLIAQARLLVISSISEGLPIVLLEAMRSGVDIVSSRVGAIPDVIEQGVSGLLYDAGDVQQLTVAIKGALAQEKGLLGGAARIRFVNEFTSEKMFLRYHSWYQFIVR